MKQMVMMVVNNPDHSLRLLEAWEAAGASGITILESTGLIRMREAGARDDLPLLPSLFDLMRGRETHHRTMFSVVEDEAQAQALVEATEQAFAEMDELDLENSGVLFVLPVTEVHRFATERARERVADR
jgi:hypothetical protein